MALKSSLKTNLILDHSKPIKLKDMVFENRYASVKETITELNISSDIIPWIYIHILGLKHNFSELVIIVKTSSVNRPDRAKYDNF